METKFIGENLLPGQLGNFFIVLSFIASLLSAWSYFSAARNESGNPDSSRTWTLLGRNSFIIHSAAILGVFITLYYIISHHLFEYAYAYEHSSRSLPMKYLLSCFWEGQQGSFLLWSFWHCVLGLIVMATAKGLESRTMAVISLVQVALATMVLGIYIGDSINIGSSPFILLREQMQAAPIFRQANYLKLIEDGNGLNVLLQNYWMVIHPPVLFLGFAATLVPFAYCIAALWKGDFKEWVKPTLVWALFAGAALGIGIMMGGAWAYESLTFGGYWAWDPVENASLVPWLILIAAIHTLLIYKATNRSFLPTQVFFILTYGFVWYSTFLTRTGVLGDTSVHAFTGEGKSLYWHLLIVIGVLLFLSIALLIKRWKQAPRIASEENLSSREFWMFIGSFVLLLSSVQISISTSIPVWSPLAKWITGKDIAPPIDPVAHYNSIQVWVAVIIGILSAAVQYLKYQKTDPKKAIRGIGIPAGISIVVTIVMCYLQQISGLQYVLLVFASWFALIANLAYAFGIQKGKLGKAGAAVTHIGFAMMLIGITLSSYNKEVLSYNLLGQIIDYGKKTMAENVKESRENVMLFINTPVQIGPYMATYKGDSVSDSDPRTFYKVHYVRKDSVSGKVLEEFTLYPDAFINPKGQQGLVANPDSKHYLTRDIFTYVTVAMDPSKKIDTASYTPYKLKKGDSTFFDNCYMVYHDISTDISNRNYKAQSGDIAVSSLLTVHDMSGNTDTLHPVYYIRDKYENIIEDTSHNQKLMARFSRIFTTEDAIEIQIKKTDPKDDYIVLKALLFPYINVLWLGIIVMGIGFLVSMVHRIRHK